MNHFSLKIGGIPIEQYAIILPQNALPGICEMTEKAASLLARYSLTLPILTEAESAPHEIVIGATSRDTARVIEARNSIVNDGYAMLFEGGRLYLTATTGRGVAYAIVSFLEDFLGVRFCTPTFTVVHPEAAKSIPEDLYRVVSPRFLARDTYWDSLLKDKDFSLLLKNNSDPLPKVGGGIAYAGFFCHTLADLAEEPHEIGKQPCLTDEKVYETVLKNVRAWLADNPNASIISVSQNDSYSEQLGCQCERCRAIDEREGTPMGSLLTFVNRIADVVKEEHPGVYVDTLAYRYTRRAPKTIKPRDNVIIRLCSIECCFSHPISDEDCPNNTDFRRDMDEWAAICKHLYVWDYNTNYLYYLAPFPNLHILREDVRFYHDHNAIGLFMLGNYQSRSGEFEELKAYLTAKLLWNPEMSEAEYEELMNGFLRDYYGEGWRYLRTYIDRTCEEAAKRHLGVYDNPASYLPATDAFYKEMKALWDSAMVEAQTDEMRAHIEQSSIQLLYFSRFCEGVESEEREKNLHTIYRIMDKYGITHFRESTPTPPYNPSAPFGLV